MAEKDPLDQLEEQLKCAVCLDTYTDPKVLLCNHAYCKECIDKLPRNNSHSIACPNCRKVTLIPENGVKDLQPAFRINNLFEIQDSLKKKATTAGAAVSHCNEHGEEEVKLYCETCEKLICFHCVIKGAKHHECEYGMLTELSDKYKGEIMASLSPLKENLGTIDNAVELLAMRREEITDLCDVVGTSIKDTIQQLQEALNVRQTQLLNQLQQIADKKLASLADQTAAIKAVRVRLEQCHSSVEEKLEASSKEEIVCGKNELVREIEKANFSFEPNILTPSTEADVKFTSSPEATRVCMSSGSLYASELLPDPKQCYATGPGLEAAEEGEMTSVVVNSVNFWGNPCEGEVLLQSKLVSEITGKTQLLYAPSFYGSQCNISYTPKIKGHHQLHVKIADQHIKGSPFTVRVKSKRYEDLIVNFGFLLGPWGIVVNHKNEIVVSEENNHCVSVFHSNGRKLRSFGSRGSEEGQFDHPHGVTVDDEDNIIIADSRNNRIQKFSAYGRFLSVVGTKGSGALQFSRPRDLAFSTFNKKLYVIDRSQRVQILNLDLSFCCSFMGHRGIVNPVGAGGCWGVECDRFGRVYISILGMFGQISVFSAEGTLLQKSFGNFGIVGYPFSIAIDSHDTLFISDYNKGVIHSFNLGGEHLGCYGKGYLVCPHGVAVGDCDVLYVCNDEDKVSIF